MLSFFPVDSRFSVEFSSRGYDISDKSMYMTGLRAMRDLSRMPFDSLVAGMAWEDPQYGDVEIALFTKDVNLKAKHAMWSIFQAMVTMGRDQFRSMQGTIYWTEPGHPRLEVGRMLVVKAGVPGLVGLVGYPHNGTHLASKDSRNALVRRVAASTGLEAESTVTASKNDTLSLNVKGSRNLKVEFEGPTLNKLGVFICIYGAIVGAASAPHPFADFDHASLSDDATRVELEFQLRPGTQHGRLAIDDIVFMLYSIPRYMYNNNKFRDGQFVLLINDVPLLEGALRKMRW
ncbi:MAG: hypothetical protein Q9195_004062 [Heterodermia aff. obscurata]